MGTFIYEVIYIEDLERLDHEVTYWERIPQLYAFPETPIKIDGGQNLIIPSLEIKNNTISIFRIIDVCWEAHDEESLKIVPVSLTYKKLESVENAMHTRLTVGFHNYSEKAAVLNVYAVLEQNSGKLVVYPQYPPLS